VNQARAADILVQTLAAHGVDRVFCVPGESYLAVLDALHDHPGIDVVTCRHEGGAAFMAVADARLTGRVGVALVSRGPGATNASIAVHTAQQDGEPMLLLVGQVERRDRGRGAFQEVDYVQTFGDMAKWVREVEDPEQVPEAVARAIQIASSGTPGPVVLALPEDMLTDAVTTAAAQPLPIPRALPGASDIAAVAAMLAKAERPLLIAGGALRGSRNGGAGPQALLAASEAWQLPVGLTFKQQDLIDNAHPNYGAHLSYGIPKRVVDAVSKADLILAVGTRLGDVTSQNYTFPQAPVPAQPLIHVHADPAVIGRVHAATRGIVADPTAFLAALAAHPVPSLPAGRAAWIASLHDVHVDMHRFDSVEQVDGVHFGAVAAALNGVLAPDAIVTIDAGNHSTFVHRHLGFNGRRVLLSAISGAMGFGMPAGVAAALRHPDRQVVTFIGDGGTLMTGNELATAIQHGGKPKVFISNNGSYATIRLHQERAFPGRKVATHLANPDFAKFGEAFGALGLRLDRQADCQAVVRRALAHDGAVVVDVRSSLEQISAYTTLAALKPAG